MDYDTTITTTADLDHAWAALAAVTTYPQWTTSMTKVIPLDGDELRVGRRYRILQPGFPPVVWRVTEVVSGSSFQWEARSPGLRTVASHRLSPEEGGGTRITLHIAQTGLLARLMAALTATRTRRYLALEAAGLRAAAEAAQAAAAA
jgi:uncharacterized protein YndB with AHSA1/START domain